MFIDYAKDQPIEKTALDRCCASKQLEDIIAI